MASVILSETLKAYASASYTVIHEDGSCIDFKVEETNPDLQGLLEARGAQQAYFVTAYNPRSEALSEEENLARQEELVRHCIEKSIQFLRGSSSDSSSSDLWLEQCLLLFCDADSGRRLGNMFEQNSIVEISGGGLPSLLNLR